MRLLGSAALLIFWCGTGCGTAMAAERVPTCADLKWSAAVLEANPDIRQSCLGVYVRNNKFYARSEIELLRISGDVITFRPRWRDGSLGKARRITVPASWRAQIDGVDYRVNGLSPGQTLNVYIPEDRFALTTHGGDGEDESELLPIEEVEAPVYGAPKPKR